MEKNWNKIRGRLPNTHNWTCNFVKKEKKKRKAMAGIIIRKKKYWGTEKVQGEKMEKRVIISKVKGKEKRKTIP